MNLLQSYFRTPMYGDTEVTKSLREHVHRSVRERFYDELDSYLQRTPGGILLAQPKLAEKVEEDWLFHSGNTMLISMTAVVEELPEPPLYRLIGGPADGYMVRTSGQREWMVPVAPPPPSMSSYVDMNTPVPMSVAVYERQGDTAAYFYKRMDRR